jgi:hypothetical protein
MTGVWHNLDEESLEEIVAAYKPGILVSRLASVYGVSGSAVHHHLRKRKAGKLDIEIVRASIRVLRTVLTRLRLDMRYQETREARELRQRAHSRVKTALREGALTRQPCEMCGRSEDEFGNVIEAHHDDYQQPLAVR